MTGKTFDRGNGRTFAGENARWADLAVNFIRIHHTGIDGRAFDNGPLRGQIAAQKGDRAGQPALMRLLRVHNHIVRINAIKFFEALAGGPLGRLRDGDVIRIVVDRVKLMGQIDLIGEGERRFDPNQAAQILAERPPHPDLQADPALPDDTRLWAALQNVSGGTWGGCVYDVDEILKRLDKG